MQSSVLHSSVLRYISLTYKFSPLCLTFVCSVYVDVYITALNILPQKLHYLCYSHSGGHGTCLEDEPWTNKLIEAESELTLAGELFNASKQCQYVFGLSSRICPYMVCLGFCFVLYTFVLFATNNLMCGNDRFCHHMVDE